MKQAKLAFELSNRERNEIIKRFWHRNVIEKRLYEERMKFESEKENKRENTNENFTNSLSNSKRKKFSRQL